MFDQNLQRIGRSDYWLAFIVCYGVGVLASVGFGVGQYIGSFILTVLAVLALLGSSIKLRIAQMERCNDIGWPWHLPWIVFGVGLAVMVLSNVNLMLALVMMPVLIITAIGDLAFGVVLGCMPSRQFDAADFDPQAYRDAYRDYGAPNFSRELAAEVAAKQEQAKVHALADPRYQSASGKRIASVIRDEAPPAPPPRVAGFGRKGILG